MTGTDQARMDAGKLLAGLGAAILLIALFIDWYALGPGSSTSVSAWTAFEIVDLLLAALAVLVIVAAVGPLLPGTRLATIPGALIVRGAGPVALILVSVSLVNEPPAVNGAQLEAGGWLALAGAAVICAGALLALNRISVVISPREPGGNPQRQTPTKPEPAPADGEPTDKTQTMRRTD